MQEPEVTTAEELEAAGQGTLLEPQPVAPPTVVEPAEVAHVNSHMPPAPNPLEMLAGALERGVDPDKLEKMFDLAERHETKEAKRQHFAALAAFQAECPPIIKNKIATVTSRRTDTGYSYAYSDLDNIMSQIRPLLGKHGLSVTFDTEFAERSITSLCHVAHAGGHVEIRTFKCPIDFDASMNDSQKMGSANSYANRYNVVNALGLTTGEDDDAAQGAKNRADTPAAPSGPRKSLDEAVPFGKHKGQPWDQVPIDYLEWMISNANEADVRTKAASVLKDRQTADEAAQDAAGVEGEPTMAECARSITNAKSVRELDDIREIIPAKHWDGLKDWFETRRKELAAG